MIYTTISHLGQSVENVQASDGRIRRRAVFEGDNCEEDEDEDEDDEEDGESEESETEMVGHNFKISNVYSMTLNLSSFQVLIYGF
jgi:hypothetical protein